MPGLDTTTVAPLPHKKLTVAPINRIDCELTVDGWCATHTVGRSTVYCIPLAVWDTVVDAILTVRKGERFEPQSSPLRR